MNRIIIGHLNINSLRNKFESLQEQINGNVDNLLISGTKLENSFPNGQFLIKGYSAIYRLDRDAQGGGIMLFIREDISSKLLEFCDTYNLKILIREPTCYKIPEDPSCIDFILTNRTCSFRNSCVFETGL